MLANYNTRCGFQCFVDYLNVIFNSSFLNLIIGLMDTNDVGLIKHEQKGVTLYGKQHKRSNIKYES